MCRFYCSILILASFFSTAQVGINTKNPTRMLHIEGDLKIRVLKDVSDDSAYDRILVADANGNIDYTSKKSFLPNIGEGASDKESYSEIYNSSNGGGNPNKQLKCGKFFFIFDDNVNDSNIMFGLNDPPQNNISVYMSMEQNWSSNGFQFYQGNGNINGVNAPFVFTTSNYNKAQAFKSSRVDAYEQNVMIFQYPGDSDLYRLTVYKVKHSDSNFDFVSACEKF